MQNATTIYDTADSSAHAAVVAQHEQTAIELAYSQSKAVFKATKNSDGAASEMRKSITLAYAQAGIAAAKIAVATRLEWFDSRTAPLNTDRKLMQAAKKKAADAAGGIQIQSQIDRIDGELAPYTAGRKAAKQTMRRALNVEGWTFTGNPNNGTERICTKEEADAIAAAAKAEKDQKAGLVVGEDPIDSGEALGADGTGDEGANGDGGTECNSGDLLEFFAAMDLSAQLAFLKSASASIGYHVARNRGTMAPIEA